MLSPIEIKPTARLSAATMASFLLKLRLETNESSRRHAAVSIPHAYGTFALGQSDRGISLCQRTEDFSRC